MLLTDAERLKFATYCHQNANDLNLLVGQMKTIPGPAGEAIAKQKQIEAHAFWIVAQILDSTESFEVG